MSDGKKSGGFGRALKGMVGLSRFFGKAAKQSMSKPPSNNIDLATNLEPPESLQDLPGKIFAAWKSLGAELGEEQWEQFQRSWAYNQSPVREPVVRDNLQVVIDKGLPVQHFPGWAERIGEIMLSAAAPEKDVFLFYALLYFLPGSQLLGMKSLRAVCTDAVESSLPEFIPWDSDDCVGIANLIPNVETIQSARILLGVLKRREEGVPILKELLTRLPDEILQFEDNGGEFLYPAMGLTYGIKDPELLETFMRRGNEPLRAAAISCSRREDWSGVLDIARQYPDDFRRAGRNLFPDVPLMVVLWESDTSENRSFAIEKLMFRLMRLNGSRDPWFPHEGLEQLIDQLQKFLKDDEARVVAVITESSYRNLLSDLKAPTLEKLWALNYPALSGLFLPAMVQLFTRQSSRSRQEEDREQMMQLASEIILHDPTALAGDYPPAELSHLLVCIRTDELVQQTSEILKPIAAKSKPVQRELVKGLCKASPKTLDQTGWLNDKRKAVREVGLEALLLSDNAEAGSLLRQIHDDKKTSDANRERITSKLDQLGSGLEGLKRTSDLSADELEAKAASTKVDSLIEKVWSDDLAKVFLPVKASVAQWALNLTCETKETTLPRAADDVMAKLPPNKQAEVVGHLVNAFITSNGDSKLRWVMLFVCEFGDDRIVDSLFDAFKRWHKKAHPKAVFALQTLGALDTQYALSRLYEIRTTAGFTYAREEAGGILNTAAASRNISLLDLIDELTPDFGLGPDGLVLDVGSYEYMVTVTTDLSLRIRNSASDKITKTLPKAKAGEDENKRGIAEAQFNHLRTNLKKVAKQQAARLEEAMLCERNWPASRWQILFLDHPLLGLMGQGLIWRMSEGKSFRISEDHSLIAPNDDAVTLSETDTISLWHPIHAGEEEIEAWKQHLNDYEIKPLFEQADLPCLRLTEDEKQSKSVNRFAETKIDQLIIKGAMKSWNYQVEDQSGSWIYGYERYFPLIATRVLFIFEELEVFNDPGSTAPLKSIEFYSGGRENTCLAEVPEALVSMVLAQGNTLIDRNTRHHSGKEAE